MIYPFHLPSTLGVALTHVGLFLKGPVFSHRQLYVVVSRVTSREGLNILVCIEDGDGTCDFTVNVVYKEVF